MSWTESYHCDVCGKAKSETGGDWWLAWMGSTAGEPGSEDEPMLKMTGWNGALSHAAEVRHLCGARCAQTVLDRWMGQASQQGG